MPRTRREFLNVAAGGGAALASTQLLDRSAPRLLLPPPQKKLDLLILGGTGFLGPHIVEAALARGHSMTLFNRQRTNADLFPDLEKLKGNRDPNKEPGPGLATLKAEISKGRRWHGVFDTSAYFPRVARASAELLADAADHYVFISSVSVYSEMGKRNLLEDDAVGKIEDETVERIDGQTYGPLKALCEQAVEKAMPGRACNVRPGLIVGPLDNTDRFSYWPIRVHRGGEILAPGNPDDAVQYIDARDLAEFCVYAAEQKHAGYFNAVGPKTETNIAELLYGCKAVTGGDAKFTWVPADFLAENKVMPWGHMPVWVPPDGEAGGLSFVSNKRIVDAGMKYRPLAETVKDLLDWFHGLPEERQKKLRAGIAGDREKEVLRLWHETGPQ